MSRKHDKLDIESTVLPSASLEPGKDDELRTIYEVSKLLSASLDINKVFRALLNLLSVNLGIWRGMICLELNHHRGAILGERGDGWRRRTCLGCGDALAGFQVGADTRGISGADFVRVPFGRMKITIEEPGLVGHAIGRRCGVGQRGAGFKNEPGGIGRQGNS